MPGSIFELTDGVMGWDCHCRVMHEKRRIYWDKWRDNPENLDLLRHPYPMFHLACYGIFAESGRLFDWDEIRGKVHTTYMALRHRYGDFLA